MPLKETWLVRALPPLTETRLGGRGSREPRAAVDAVTPLTLLTSLGAEAWACIDVRCLSLPATS